MVNRHLVLGMRRSTQELDDAYHAFTKLSLTFKQVLQNWHTEESRIKSDSIYVFQRAFQLFEAQALDVAMQAIENTLHEVHWREKVEVRCMFLIVLPTHEALATRGCKRSDVPSQV